jgi:uncharacterized phage protein gp47/JayE
MAKTFDVIINEIVNRVNSTLGQQDTRVGTVLREGFLAPLAVQLEEAFTRTDTVELNQSIAAAAAVSDEAMERIAANFGLARFPGSPASGTLRFSRFQAPAAPIVIPANSIATTSDVGDFLGFRTLAAASLTAISPQDPITGAYFVDIPAIATSSGSAGNVEFDTIRFQSIPGIDEVTNPLSFFGGKDAQTNTELAELMSARAQGNLGTRNGYEGLIRSNFAVDDMDIITPTDPEATRAQFSGELDITILSGISIESQETAAHTTTTFTPTFRPLISVNSITGIEDITNNVITMVEGPDYDVIIDTFSPLSRSFIEKSRINFHVTTFTVKPGSVFTILYSNSELVRIIQSFIADAQNEILGADVLVKLAISVPVNISADIRIIPGFDPATVQADTEDAVNEFFNSKLLGDDVQVSDVVTVMGSIPGVDSVDLTTFEMAKASAPSLFLQEVLANKQEYLRAGTVVITVVG